MTVRRAVMAVVLNGEGEVLVMERAATGDWQFVRGGIEEGESAEQALARELGEEAGISEYELLGRSEHALHFTFPEGHHPVWTSQHNTVFVVRVSDTDVCYPDAEMCAHDWLSPDSVCERLTYEDTGECFERVRAEFGF